MVTSTEIYSRIPWELFADHKGSRDSHFGNRSSRGLQPVSLSEKTRFEGFARQETNCRDVVFAAFRIMQGNTEIVPQAAHHVAVVWLVTNSCTLRCTRDCPVL